MDKRKKVTLVAVFAVILVVFGVAAFMLNQRETQEGQKRFLIEVISERDNYSEMTECISDLEFLGEFMRTFAGCEWQESDYGIYITGFDGMVEDMENQYWWCITVNDQESMLGADETPLEAGSKYTFTLKQGW